MRYAETGYYLDVNLTTGNIERIESDPHLSELHLGGNGTAARIIWDRVPPDLNPLAPENVLIFSVGLLAGTPVPGANRTMVNTISPQTNLWVNSMLGGYFGPELKFAGYDKVILTGAAPELSYLYIHNDKVEIRDASHLKGKDTVETQKILLDELGPEFQIACIGLAGENVVYGASIEHASSSAARTAGPVMGSKKLKAIAVRGTKDLNIAEPEKLWKLSESKYAQIAEEPDNGDPMRLDPTNDAWHMDNFAWGNARERRRGYWTDDVYQNDVETTDKARLRWVGCYNCPKSCKQMIELPDGRKFFTKCFNRLIYMMGAYVEDFNFSYEILHRSQAYGMDGFATPQLLGFAVELYENGVLTDEDLPNFPKDNAARFFYLLDITVRREGMVGDALADGVYWAARKIGRGAEKYDHNTTKKQEQVPLKLGRVNFNFFLMYCTGEKMSITQIEGSFPQTPEPDIEKRKELVRGWDAAPQKFKDMFMAWEPRTDLDIEESCAVCEWNELMHYVDDSVGTCAWLSAFRGQFGCRAEYHMNNLPDYINYAAGYNLTMETLWETVNRNRTLVRAINNRRGLRRVDEAPPLDHWKIREPEREQECLSAYYAFKGWTNDAIPTKGTLDKLQLDYVATDLIERGILPSDGGVIGG